MRQCTSWKIAEQTRHWVDQSHFTDRPVVRIDPHELRWFERWNLALYEWRLSHLCRHDVLPITYESLCDDWDETICRVQEFIGVEPFKLRQATSKQETRPLCEVIENWSEIHGHQRNE